MRSGLRAASVALALGLTLVDVSAQQRIRPASVQLRLDVATRLEASGDTSEPAPLAPGESRTLAAWLVTPPLAPGAKPVYRIPAALKSGAVLALAPSEDQAAPPPALPSGVVRHYWGCAEVVPAGQPLVLDPARQPADAREPALRGRRPGDEGEAGSAGTVSWSTPQAARKVPPDASLVGEHAVSVPGAASLRFGIGRKHDFPGRVQLAIIAQRSGALQVRWQPIPTARAFFLQAQGAGHAPGETVVWTSSLLPEPGYGLFGYLSDLAIDTWLAQGVLLPTSLSRCAIPAGIFSAAQPVRVAMIAYGNGFTLVQPRRPPDPSHAPEPDWSLQVRFTSSAEVMASVPAGDPGPAAPAPRRSFDILRRLLGQ